MDVLTHPNLTSHGHVIRLQAEHAGLPTALVGAMCLVESAGDTHAWRPEPYYRWLWDVSENAPYAAGAKRAMHKCAPDDFPSRWGTRDAEWWGQQASWGLMQVMGGVARELGFDPREPLTMLCQPELGLAYGCAHLLNMKHRFFAEHGWPGVVAAYNAGSPRFDTKGRFINREYVEKVREYVDLAELPA